jgi:hypothetical protein
MAVVQYLQTFYCAHSDIAWISRCQQLGDNWESLRLSSTGGDRSKPAAMPGKDSMHLVLGV